MKENLRNLEESQKNSGNFDFKENENEKEPQKDFLLSDIFDLKKKSLKEIEENLNELSSEMNENDKIKMHLEHSFVYLNINIDKSFEIFLEKIRNGNFLETSKNEISLLEVYLERFISRILELDRIVYVKKN